MSDSSKLCDRYLDVLGVAARPPSIEALGELVAANLARVPFENVSKLYYRHDASRRGVSELGRFLDGIERHRFGGTCYAVGYHFHQLLARLGYRVSLCGADMARPNVHLVNVVTLADRRFLVDVGYGAPLIDPVPLDEPAEREFSWGDLRYRIRPRGDDGRPALEMYRGRDRLHGYAVNLASRRIEDFVDVIAASFAADATFMNALLVARFAPRRSATLRNLTLAVQDGAIRTSIDVTASQIPEVVEHEFGMPRDIVRQALDGVALSSPL